MAKLKTLKRETPEIVSDKQKKLDTWWKRLENFSMVFAVIFFICCKILVVNGSSMETTYYNGNLLIGVRAWSAEELASKNYPVCVAKPLKGLVVIKRLVGTPGDKVELINGNTYVNGELVMMRDTASWDNMSFELGDDEWLLLGDNRANSYDGRFWPGNVVSFKQISFWVPGSELGIR